MKGPEAHRTWKRSPSGGRWHASGPVNASDEWPTGFYVWKGINHEPMRGRDAYYHFINYEVAMVSAGMNHDRTRVMVVYEIYDGDWYAHYIKT